MRILFHLMSFIYLQLSFKYKHTNPLINIIAGKTNPNAKNILNIIVIVIYLSPLYQIVVKYLQDFLLLRNYIENS